MTRAVATHGLTARPLRAGWLIAAMALMAAFAYPGFGLAQDAEEAPAPARDWSAVADVVLDAEADVRRRSSALRELLQGGIEHVAARDLVANRLLDPAASRETLVSTLTELVYFAEDSTYRPCFAPQYFSHLLLISERDPARTDHTEEGPLRALAVRVMVNGYSAQARRDVLLEAVRQPTASESRESRLQLAAIRAMADSRLADLVTQVGHFAPALIDSLCEAGSQSAGAVHQAQATLRSITEYRSAESPEQWIAWWQQSMATRSASERVQVVVENLRRQRERLQAELARLQVNEQLRAVAASAGNLMQLQPYLDPDMPEEVVIAALRHVQTIARAEPLAEARGDALLGRLRALFPAASAPMRIALAETATLLGTSGETLVRERAETEAVPAVRAAMIGLLARHGRQRASLDVVLAVFESHRDTAPEVLLAAFRNLPSWRHFDDAAAAACIESLVALTADLARTPNQSFGVELHNMLNELSQSIDITNVIEVLIAPATNVGTHAMSRPLQLQVIRQALAGAGADSLRAKLMSWEREHRFLLAALSNSDRPQSELVRVIEILARLGDPMLDFEHDRINGPTPDSGVPRTIYEALARLNRRASSASDESSRPLREAIAAAFQSFAAAELERFVAGPPDRTPELRVFMRMMDLGLAGLARDTVLPKVRDEHRDVAERHELVFRLVDTRLGLRLMETMTQALPTYAGLVRAGHVSPEVQREDLAYAMREGGTSYEMDARIMLLPRLVVALHPHGSGTPTEHVFHAIDQRLQGLSNEAAPQPDSLRHAMRLLRALYDYPEARRVLTGDHTPGEDFRARVGSIRNRINEWQRSEWSRLRPSIESDRPLPSTVREFVLDRTTQFRGIDSVDDGTQCMHVAVPPLVQRLGELAYVDPLAASIWNVLREALDATNVTVPEWPADAETFAQALSALRSALRADERFGAE